MCGRRRTPGKTPAVGDAPASRAPLQASTTAAGAHRWPLLRTHPRQTGVRALSVPSWWECDVRCEGRQNSAGSAQRCPITGARRVVSRFHGSRPCHGGGGVCCGGVPRSAEVEGFPGEDQIHILDRAPLGDRIGYARVSNRRPGPPTAARHPERRELPKDLHRHRHRNQSRPSAVERLPGRPAPRRHLQLWTICHTTGREHYRFRDGTGNRDG